MGSGPGYTHEGVFDNLSFTIECRGADRNYDDAEYLARLVDDAILKYGPESYTFDDGVYLDFIGRVGGPPSELAVFDTAGRYAYTCNYYCTVATDL